MARSLVLALAACSSPAPPSTVVTAPPPVTSHEPQAHRFSNNWGTGLGCTPKGEELSLTGLVVVRPFGKGTDGALLKTDTEEWVVSYRAEGTLLALQGKRVLARGRACDKQGAAISGRHLDLSTLTESTR